MFSEKYGYKPEKKILFNEVSLILRNRIWNLFYQEEIQAGGLASERLAMALNGIPRVGRNRPLLKALHRSGLR